MIKARRITRYIQAVARQAEGRSVTARLREAAEFDDQDAAITAEVMAAIGREPALYIAGLGVSVDGGRVQLRGFVSFQTDIARTMAIADGVAGVKSVRSELQSA